MKPTRWVGSSLHDLRAFPPEVCRSLGYALQFAQQGDLHPTAKPLKGFHGAHVVEIADSFAGNAFRLVYTTVFAEAIYVLHVFQKKSKKGIATPRSDIEVVKSRLKWIQRQRERGTK